MAGGGGVQNGNIHAVMHNLQHARHQESGVQHDRLARLQIDFHIICAFEMLNHPNQTRDIIIRAGDVVTSAEVQPLHAVQIPSEFALERLHSGFQIVRILLAQRVKMQSVQHGQDAFVQLRQRCAQTRAGRTGIINCMSLLCGAFRIDAQTNGLAAFLCARAEFLYLRRRIEADMVGIAQNFLKLIRAECRRKHVRLSAEFLRAQTGLMQSARRCARQIAPHQRITGKHGKRLLCKQDFAACPVGNRLEDV